MNGVNHTHTHIIREGWKPHHQSQENHLPVLSVRKLVRDTMLALVLKGLDQNWFNQETALCQKAVETEDRERRLECCALLFHQDCIQKKFDRDERCPSCGHSHGPRRPVSIDASRPWDYPDHILARHLGCCHCCEGYCGGNGPQRSTFMD